MTGRLRIVELMKAAKYRGPYEMVKDAEARGLSAMISEATLYRLARNNGKFETITRRSLEALAILFNVSIGELFEDRPRGKTR